MHQMGLVCALTLLVITCWFCMDWDPEQGPAPPAFLCNHPSALAEATFVAEAIAAGVTAHTMWACSSEELICILQPGVAFNSALKLCLIWDGQHVNHHLRMRPFCMETLQREGRTLFERSSFSSTINILSAYHHVEMAPSMFPYLGFKWATALKCSRSGSRLPSGSSLL